MNFLTMTAVFAALKITNEISWSWWGVFMPLIIAAIIVVYGWLKEWLSFHW